MSDPQLNFLIVAGEASGDLHAAKLVRALADQLSPAVTGFYGSAGPRMREAGVDAIVRADALSVVGVPEIGRRLSMFLDSYKKLKAAARERSPAAAVLVDFPDFNLRLARSLKRMGVTVIYYISPQLWAWRRHRLRMISKYVDLMITILPFEKDWYARRGFYNVEYVGNPLVREVHAEVSREEFRRRNDIDETAPMIALLPGSRNREIARILPEMLRSADAVKSAMPETQFIIAGSSAENSALIHDLVKHDRGDRSTGPANPRVVTGRTYDVLNAADAAAITSGTATLEAAILGTPMVIAYKTSEVNYRLLRPLISVEHFGLINLIAGERIVTELIQDELTPATLSTELLRLLDPATNESMRKRLATAVNELGNGGASTRAANAIIELLERKRSNG